jgi:integrase
MMAAVEGIRPAPHRRLCPEAMQSTCCAASRGSPLIKPGTTHPPATVIDWASQTVSVAQRHTRYQTACEFARYVRQEDPLHESPPPNHFGYRKTRRVPRIYSPAEIDRLILAAKQLPPQDALRPLTYATLISLLAATGLRISEALHLLVSDITPSGLLIRKTKPEDPSGAASRDRIDGLRRCLTQRRGLHAAGAHLFSATAVSRSRIAAFTTSLSC